MSAVETRSIASHHGSAASPKPNRLGGSKRIVELDGLRGLACLMVVLSHTFIFPADMGGVVGVTIFFVLSGYLITTLLLIERVDHGAIGLGSFYGRRAIRLVPALVVYLLGIALILAAFEVPVAVWDVTWPPALYVSNYAQIMGHYVAPHTHTWSLAVEEHFYLIWPVLLILGAAKRIRPLVWAVVLLFGWRVYAGGIDLLWGYQGTDTNAYALAAGCLLAVVRHHRVAPLLPRCTPVVGVAFCTAAIFVPVDDLQSFFATAIWLAPAIVLVSVIVISSTLDHRPAFLRWRPLTWFGTISYSLYLWHAPFMLIKPFSESVIGRIVGLMLAVALAAASWYLVEKPILGSSLRFRLQRSRLSSRPETAIREPVWNAKTRRSPRALDEIQDSPPVRRQLGDAASA